MRETWRKHPVYGRYLERIESVFLRAWCLETCAPTYRGFWSPSNPAVGQCVVTALILAERMKRDHGIESEILTCFIPGLGTHYWNMLPDGTEVDLTRRMFPDNLAVPPGLPTTFMQIPDARRHLPDLFARLDLLRERFDRAAMTL